VPAKLLVADDSTTIQKVFERTFPPEEFTLSFANNGEEALAKARTERPQLIIADINMPLKNGFEVCEVIKKDPALKGIPVMLLIGILDDFDEDESRRVGADGFIVKPFETNAALGKVREALTKGGGILPTERPAVGQAEEVMELADIIKESLATSPPTQRQGEEEILELGDIIKESPATSPPTQRQGEEEFVLQTPLRELEAELKAEFPEEKEKEEDKKTPVVQEEEKEEPWSLNLDLPLDEMELEPQTKDVDWTGLFGDLDIEGPSQEIKDERLGTILGESATELERIEGLGLKKDKPKEEFAEKSMEDFEPLFDESATELKKIEGFGLKKDKPKEEEFAEKFMEDFEPVFEREERGTQHIDVFEKDLKEISPEDKEELAERVASALSHELQEVVEEVIKNKIPKLVRRVMEQSKKE
jgi:CheY-like chemotaxis protein